MAEHILLVEDEEKLARMVELELKYEGYSVEKAFDGRKGLELALSGAFDLVLLDIMLPQLSGIEVRPRLRRETHILRLTAVQDFAVSCLLTRISLRSAIMSSAAMKRNAVSSDLCWAMKPSRAGPAIRPP